MYTGQRAVTLWGSEGDRSSGDALAICHRLCCYTHTGSRPT